LPGPKELAAPVALGDLHPLVLRDRPLDLDEETGVGILARRLLQEDDPNVEALELLEDEDLIGVLTSQTIGAEDQHHLERPGLRPIPEAIEAGAIQPGAAVAVIDADVRLDHLVSLLAGVPAQRVELRGNRALLFLPLSGDPRVDGDSHRRPPPRRSGASATSRLPGQRHSAGGTPRSTPRPLDRPSPTTLDAAPHSTGSPSPPPRRRAAPPGPTAPARRGVRPRH
jgi:hypothetical protein